MTQPGETDGYGAYEHVQAIIKHMGCQCLDYVVVNEQQASPEQIANYKQKGSMPVTPDVEKLNSWALTACRPNC